MQPYFFDLNEDGDVTVDEEGIELASIAAARDQAVRAARDIMTSEIARGRLCLDHAIIVRDIAGAVVMTVPFTDAVAVTTARRG